MTSSSQSNWLFFARFLRNPRSVGALLPSTAALGAEMVRGLALGAGDLVVEYGPGTGALTQSIAGHIAAIPGVRYLGIEREEKFCEVLRRRFPALGFACGQVEDVRTILESRGLGRPRAILSGLPLILLPTMNAILDDAATLLRPGGEFRTFTYLQSWPTPNAFRLRRRMQQRFAHSRRSRLVLGNLPPAWVLCGTTAVSA